MLYDNAQPQLYPRPPLPLSLKIVGWLFIVFGTLSAVDIITSLVAGKLNLNFGVLQIFIGWGLLRLSPGWRIAALVCLWLGFALAFILAVASIFASNLKVTWFGERLSDSAETRLVALAIIALILLFP